MISKTTESLDCETSLMLVAEASTGEVRFIMYPCWKFWRSRERRRSPEEFPLMRNSGDLPVMMSEAKEL